KSGGSSSQSGIGANNDVDKDEAKKDTDTSKGTKDATCPENYNQDYSEIRQKLNHEFYFPECSDLVSVDDKGSTLEFVLNHDISDVKPEGKNDAFAQAMINVHSGYKEFAGDNVYFDYQQFGFGYGDVNFYLHGNQTGDTKVHYEMGYKHMTIEVTYEYP